MEFSQVATAAKILCCIFVSFFLSACQRAPGQLPDSTSETLPTPPFAELENRVTTGRSELSLPSKTIEETLSSIKKIQTLGNKTQYRAHLEELSSQVFQKSATSSDPHVAMFALLASASCHHPLSPSLSRSLILSQSPILQLTAIQALSSLQTSDANSILIDALRSDYAIIRLEAAWCIASKHMPDAFFHIDSLSYKLPEEGLVYMPELFAIEGSPSSVHKLRQFLYSANDPVIVETLLAIGRHRITSLSEDFCHFESHSPAILEALSFALQIIPTEETQARLKKLLSHRDQTVQLQAALSLMAMGDLSPQPLVESIAQKGDLFAIYALERCVNPIPATFSPDHPSRQTEINLALARLLKKDPSCLPSLKMILSLPNDEAIHPSLSVGHALLSWDIVKIDSFPQELQPTLYEQSLRTKEAILVQALELPEESFLSLSSMIFEEGLVELYPCLLELLENNRSQGAIELLQQESSHVGAPYNRAFASLGLIKLGVETDEKTAIIPILDLSREKEDSPWRFPLPWMARQPFDDETLQQHEAATTRLYTECIETLAQKGSPDSIEILIAELEKAPPQYLPLVAAALLHATL